MLRETKKFTVLEFGYEKVIPELIQQGYDEKNATFETVKIKNPMKPGKQELSEEIYIC